MSVSQVVWSLDEKKPLENASLTEEKELEDLLSENIEILNKNWMVIGRQVRTEAGKLIDLLCIDHDGDMIVVELKKDMTPREVTAQVIDYAASVSQMTSEEIAKQYLAFSEGRETLNEAFLKKFNSSLDESEINQNVKMVIVAAKMDAGTERIITFLRDVYRVDINILFFSIYKCDGQRIISRAWFEEDMEDVTPVKSSKKGIWNGEYYVSFGEGERKWEDARKYGFISAGGGSWYSQTLSLLSKDDRIWVNIPKTGFVGVGIVTESATQAKDVRFGETSMKELELEGDYFNHEDDPEKAEYIVKVEWEKTVSVSNAVHELGFFGNQNSVCRPLTDKWNFTVDRLKKIWGIV